MKNKIVMFLLIAVFITSMSFGASIFITNPHSGHIWYKGHTYTITWTKSGSMNAKVKIRLMQNGTKILGITDSTNNNGSYKWTVPSSIPDGKYVVRVKTIDNAVYDDGDVFTIATALSYRAMSVTNPRAGQTWYKGKTYTITWGGGDVMTSYAKIRLYQGNTKILDITDSTSYINGSYKWTIPSSIPDGKYVVRVRTIDTGDYDNSDAFTIATAPTRSITVTNPHSGQKLYAGGTYRITWTKSGSMAANVKIILCELRDIKGKNPIQVITMNTPNNGSFSWSIPKSIKHWEYFIMVKTIDGMVEGRQYIEILSALDPKTTAIIGEMYKNIPKIKTVQIPSPSIKIIYPKEGDIINPDADFVIIKWQNINFIQQFGQTAQINLINVDESFGKIIGDKIATPGEFRWIIRNSGIKSSNNRYKLSVTITGNKSNPINIRKYSGIFYIKK